MENNSLLYKGAACDNCNSSGYSPGVDYIFNEFRNLNKAQWGVFNIG